jgi:very-short-patch-repair endonuclease
MEEASFHRKKRRDYTVALRNRPEILKMWAKKHTVEEIASKFDVCVEAVEEVLRKAQGPKRSKGEEALYDFLSEYFHGAKIIEQYYVKGYRFDFFVPDYKLAVEYDGEFHYHYNSWVHGEGITGQVNFDEQISRDREKDRICKEMGWYLVRIPYTTELTKQTLRRIFDEKIQDIAANLKLVDSAGED